MSDEKLRLRKLIEHWAEHNDDHRARFEESAREASLKGWDDVAQSLMNASEKAAEVSELLRKAFDAFN